MHHSGRGSAHRTAHAVLRSVRRVPWEGVRALGGAGRAHMLVVMRYGQRRCPVLLLLLLLLQVPPLLLVVERL